MAPTETNDGQSPAPSNAAIWRLIRRQAHQLATLRRNPTDRELDDFTRLVERLPAPHMVPSSART